MVSNIDNKWVKDKRVLVVGFSSRSGVCAVNLLNKLGAIIFVSDQKEKKDLKISYSMVEYKEFKLYTGKQSIDQLKGIDLIVLSPGVSVSINLIQSAFKKGIPVISEVELAYRARPDLNWIGVTGTDGKSTVCSLLSYILNGAKIKNILAGNIGSAASCEVIKAGKSDTIVTELSSFQLETIDSFHPNISMILNITEDHQDRYENMHSYANAKARIFKNQNKQDYLLVNANCIETKKLLQREAPEAEIVYINKKAGRNCVFIYENNIFIKIGSMNKPRKICSLKGINLIGIHNNFNIMFAAAAASILGIKSSDISRAVKSFNGLEHRMEIVKKYNGRIFINDSKATTCNAVKMALSSLKGNVFLIAGGYDKGNDFRELKKIVNSKVNTFILLGNAAKRMFKEINFKNTFFAIDLKSAVTLAYKLSNKGDTILLSPGCASFDMYDSFEHRGKEYKKYISTLKERGWE